MKKAQSDVVLFFKKYIYLIKRMDNIWWNNNKIITIDNVKQKSVIMIAYLYS